LEKVIPPDVLSAYKEHFEQGCIALCDGECKYQNDKVYNEWKTLTQSEPDTSPKETRKRTKFNKKEERKRLKLAGKEYQKSKIKPVAERKKMEWVECKCKNKCSTKLNEEERQRFMKDFGRFGQ